MSGFPKSIVVVRLGALGDVVNALCFARAVKAHAPATRVAWVVHELALPLVEGHPDVDRVHLWPRRSGARGFLRCARELRAERYELAVDLQRIAKSAALARLSGARRVLGADRARSKEGAQLWAKERLAAGEEHGHVLPLYLEYAAHLGAPAPQPLHALAPTPEAVARAQAWLAPLGAPPVAIALGASKPANRWPAERFGVLAAELARGGAPVVLVGGPDERPLAAAAMAAASDAPPLDLVGRTSVDELAAVLASAQRFVGCDTGPMHLAAALGTPVLALFGAADERRTGPWGDAHQVLREEPACAPCRKRSCPLPRHDCMLDLSLERVLTAARAR